MCRFFQAALVLLSVCICAGQAQMQTVSLGTTVTLGNISYFVPPTPVARLDFSKSNEAVPLKKSGQSLIPFTFADASTSQFSSNQLATVLAKNDASDDVWTESFLAGMICYNLVCVSSNSFQGLHVTASSVASSVFNAGSRFTLTSSKTPLSIYIPSGPYFVNPTSGEVFEGVAIRTSWRLILNFP